MSVRNRVEAALAAKGAGGRRFATSVDALSEELGLPQEVVGACVAQLVDEGLIPDGQRGWGGKWPIRIEYYYGD